MRLLLRNLLFTLAVPGTVAGYLPWLIVRGESGSPAQIVVAGVLFAVGGAIYLRCVWDFARFGRGTPAPIDAPKRLVVRGLYRYTRNPMYLGVLTFLAGWAVLAATPAILAYGLGVALAFHLFVVGYEEPHLRRLFGAEYERYVARVARWLLPPSARRR